MEYLAKKPLSFLQDRAFASNNLNVYTSKWNILQKSRFPFCKIAHSLVIILMFILVNGISCKKVDFLFARSPFTSNNLNVYTSKWNILQKSRFPTARIEPCITSNDINVYTSIGISCKKAVFLFARCCIY